MAFAPSRLLDLVLPPSCGGCGLPGPALCAACRAALPPPPRPLCHGCGHPLPVARTRCPACVPPLERAHQACLYAGPAGALLTRFKDEGRRDLAVPLAALVADRLAPPEPGSRVVPVPAAPDRAAERGFNQARDLAEALARHWGVPLEDVLERAGGGPPQRGAPRRVRLRQAARAFRARRGAVPPARAVLVDDVHTTGATLAACARALRRAGSRRVSAVCVARVPDARLPIPPPAAYDGHSDRMLPGRLP